MEPSSLEVSVDSHFTRVKLAVKATTEVIKKLRQNAFEKLEEY